MLARLIYFKNLNTSQHCFLKFLVFCEIKVGITIIFLDNTREWVFCGGGGSVLEMTLVLTILFRSRLDVWKKWWNSEKNCSTLRDKTANIYLYHKTHWTNSVSVPWVYFSVLGHFGFLCKKRVQCGEDDFLRRLRWLIRLSGCQIDHSVSKSSFNLFLPQLTRSDAVPCLSITALSHITTRIGHWLSMSGFTNVLTLCCFELKTVKKYKHQVHVIHRQNVLSTDCWPIAS